MYVLKGFMVVQQLADNTPGKVSPIGELSTYSKTFSREIGHYSKSAHPDVDLMAFHSTQDEVMIPVPNAVVDILLPIGTWLTTESIAGRLNGNEAAFTSDFLSEFSDTVEDLTIGEMVGTENNLAYLPAYLLFKLKNYPEDTYIKLWFSDEDFRRQFDEYEIEVVPPVDNLDDLFKTPAEVKAILDGMDDTLKMVRIQTVVDDNPATRIRTEVYPWSNPIDPEISLPTSWTVIIYGPYGNNIDLIRAALIDYVLTNSSYDRDQWAEFVPDLFKRTEHIIIPLWDNYSIPNETLIQGMFSPTIRHSQVLDIATAFAPEYPLAHIQEYVTTTVANYRSMTFVSVGGPDNRDEIYDYQSRFPDYITIPTTSTEFGRMSTITQEWAVLLAKLLKTAETLTEFSDIPLTMTKLERDGILYLVASYDDIQYLIVSQQSYLALMDPDAMGDIFAGE